jgi:hypothetical protein
MLSSLLYRPRKGVLAGIIKGRRKNPFITEAHTIVTGENEDKRLHRLMDDLYSVYRADYTTLDGCGNIPWIDSLRRNDSSEFHIYSGEDGVTKGFFSSFRCRYKDLGPVPTMNFVWVVPRFRRQGLFTQMYRDLETRRGLFFVDSPNKACQVALDNIGYSGKRVISYYKKLHSPKPRPSSVLRG